MRSPSLRSSMIQDLCVCGEGGGGGAQVGEGGRGGAQVGEGGGGGAQVGEGSLPTAARGYGGAPYAPPLGSWPGGPRSFAILVFRQDRVEQDTR